MFGVLMRWLDAGYQSPPRQGVGFKLSAEELERRENPADFWWAPVNGLSATTANNWMMGPNTPYARWTTLPDYDDHLYFQSSNGGDYDCNIPLWAIPGGESPPPPPPPGAPDFAGLHTVNGYTKTVNIQRSPKIGTVELTSGTIAQSDPAQITLGNGGGTISVSSLFTWTGGNLNSGSSAPYLGYLNLLPAAVGNVTPTAEEATTTGTVNLGSSIILLSDTTTQTGSTLSLNEGYYNFNCQVDVQVRDWSTLKIKAPVPKPARPNGKITLHQGDVKKDLTKDMKENGVFTNDPEGTITIDTDGKRNFTTNEQAPVEFTADVPKLTNFGKVVISDLVKVSFIPSPGKDGLGGGLEQKMWKQPNGFFTGGQKLSIEAGCEIDCQGKTNILLDGLGFLFLTERKDSVGVPLAEQGDILISAMGADEGVRIKQPVTMRHVDGKVAIPLKINGTFYCDGSIEMYAARDTVGTYGVSDKITVKKQIVFGNDADLKVSWLGTGAGSAFGNSWTLVFSEYVDPNGLNAAITGLPTFIPPDATAPDLPVMYRTPDDTELHMDGPSS